MSAFDPPLAPWPPPHRLYLLCTGALWLSLAAAIAMVYVWLRWRQALDLPPQRFLWLMGADIALGGLLGLWLYRRASGWSRTALGPLAVLRRLALGSGVFFLVVVAIFMAAQWAAGTELAALPQRALWGRWPAAGLDYLFFWAIAATAVPPPFLRAGNAIEARAVDAKESASALPPRRRRLAVRGTGRVRYVAVDEILGVSAAENYVELHLADRSLLHRATMARMETELRGEEFLRVHRSAMVRLSAVSACECGPGERLQLRLHNGRGLPVSRSRRAQVLAALERAASAGAGPEAAHRDTAGQGAPDRVERIAMD